jgi:heme A synthase
MMCVAVDISGEWVNGLRAQNRCAKRSHHMVQFVLAQFTRTMAHEYPAVVSVLHLSCSLLLFLRTLRVFIRSALRQMSEGEPAGNAPMAVHRFQLFA